MKLIPSRSFIKNLKQKKVIIALILLTLLLPLITFLSEPQAKNDIPSAVDPSAAAVSETAKMPQDSELLKWKTFETALLYIQYAPDWFVEKGGISTGGEIIIIKPSALPGGINYPQLNIQIEPIKNVNLDQKIGLLKGLGLLEADENILGIKAKKLNGTVPFKKVNDYILKEPIQQTAYILSYKNQIITIKYSYEGAQINSDIEGYFLEVINGIKLK